MLALHNVEMTFDGKTVLEGITFTFKASDRIALIGENGSGKSTLLRIAAGILEPTAGDVHKPKDMVVGYLPQSGLFHRGQSLWEEVLSALPEWVETRERRRRLLEKISSLPPEDPQHEKALREYGEIETTYLHRSGYAQEARLKRILSGLGFSMEELEKNVEEYSAGWQMRIGLAKILAREPDLLLLDEPTAHLDLVARNWLEGYLRECKGGFVVVSHDRHFLDLLAETVLEISNKKLEIYHGNYSKYMEEKHEREERARELYLRQQEQIRKVEAFIAKNRVRKDRARQVQSRIRQLERMEVLAPVRAEDSIRFQFPTPGRAPRKILELVGVAKSYPGRMLFSGLNLTIERGERIAVVGPNGAGKSTLMRILAGREPVDRGVRFVDERVSVGWFLQDPYQGSRDRETVLEVVQAEAQNETAGRLRTFLGAFLFRGEDVFKPLSVLSGGERSRLALAALLLKRHHLLLLDEPTNHLDLKSRQALVDALRAYGGTLVFVSHDRYFIDEVATRIVEIRDGRVWSFHGNYEEFVVARAQGSARIVPVSGDGSAAGQRSGTCAPSPARDGRTEKHQRILQKELARAEQRREQKRRRDLEKTEREIQDLEQEIESVREEMARPEMATDYVGLQALHERIESLRARLEERYRHWETLAQEEGAPPGPAGVGATGDRSGPAD